MASKKRPTQGTVGNTKRIHGLGGGDQPHSIFTDGVSDMVPGELILQLESGTAAAMTQSIGRGTTRGTAAMGMAIGGTVTFGVAALDQALSTLNVRSVIRLHPPAPMTSLAMTEAVAMGDTFRITFDPHTSVEQAVAQLSQVTGVQYAEPNRWRETTVIPNDPNFTLQWGLSKINAPAAWDRTTGNASIVVAVIDTGVDLNHPELAPLLVPGFDMVDLGPNPTPPAGYRFEGDFQGRDATPQDEVGHGTHVAGTIACLSNNAAMVAGVTWQCRVMPVKVLTRLVNIANPTRVSGTGSAADIAAGIRWAVDHGARVLNMSLGGPSDTQVERDAVAYAIARGVVVCAAMGNDGPTGTTSFPAAYPGVVAVGAIDVADHRAWFSQVGPHIDLVGPGVDILSTVWDDGTATMSGTSMATPHVAGVAALVLSVKPSLSGAQVADILRQTARPLRDNPSDPVPNNSYGFGCVDALAAVNRASPPIIKTLVVTCQHISMVITCKPSTIITCQKTTPISCQLTTPLTCLKTTPITCQKPSVLTLCGPSLTLACPQPSALTRCPSTLVCGGPGRPGDPGPLLHGLGADPGSEGSDEDPYAGNYPGDSDGEPG